VHGQNTKSPTTKILIEIDESYLAHYIMVHCLLIKVTNQIKLRLNYNEMITDIVKALKVLKNLVYKLQLNFNLWDQPYVLPSVKLSKLNTLLKYQKLV
jgi:hypothetical protein